MTIATLKKHVQILQKIACENYGFLPPYAWLNANGYFGSYDTVRRAGLLWRFKRLRMREIRKSATATISGQEASNRVPEREEGMPGKC